MKTRLLALLCLAAAPAFAADATTTPTTPAPAAAPADAARIAFDPALEDHAWLLEALRHSYYWYLDEAFFAATENAPEVVVWLRSVEPARRDDGDRSRFAELWMPQAKILFSLKKADYHIDELDLDARSSSYRIVRGGYEAEAPGDPAGWRKLVLDRQSVSDELVATRERMHTPPPEIRELAVAALRREIARRGAHAGPQTFFVASRTSVTSDIWIFWEDERLILQISADMDLTDPALVRQLPLLIRRFALGKNVVASAIEARGDNSVISRDFAGRALFVCLARGEKIVVEP